VLALSDAAHMKFEASCRLLSSRTGWMGPGVGGS
jgi:hypothetical protein